jgi:hypothetical protein
MTKEKAEDYPETDKKELAHKAAKAGTSLIPILGGPIGEFFDLVIKSPLEVRRTDWLNNLAERVNSLQEKIDGFSIEQLQDDELFLSIVLQATQIAMRNHQVEKQEALLAAIQNCALQCDIEENTIILFMDIIDSMTPLHLKVLYFLNSPKTYAEDNNIIFPNWVNASLMDGVQYSIPELNGKDEFTKKIAMDLRNFGFTNTEARNFFGGMTMNGILSRRTTEFGQTFLKFVTSPVVNE